MVTQSRLFIKHDRYSSYKASCITKHYWQHRPQAWKLAALRGDVMEGHLTVVFPRVFIDYVDDIGWMGQHVGLYLEKTAFATI
jgi:hypothetical protein